MNHPLVKQEPQDSVTPPIVESSSSATDTDIEEQEEQETLGQTKTIQWYTLCIKLQTALRWSNSQALSLPSSSSSSSSSKTENKIN